MPRRRLDMVLRLHGAKALRCLGRLHKSIVYVERAYGAASTSKLKLAFMGTSRSNLATPPLSMYVCARDRLRTPLAQLLRAFRA